MNETEPSSARAPIFDEADAEAERFFAAGEAAASEGLSLSPSTLDEEEWEDAKPLAVSPELVTRRARLRRLVVVGLGGGVLSIGAAIGATRSTKPAWGGVASARPVVSSGVLVLHAALPVSAPHALPSTSPTVVVNTTLGPVAPPVASVAASASASIQANAPDLTSTAPDAVAARQLVQESRALLRAGHTREGVAVARRAVETDAALAEPYVLLAAGLEDLGDWSEAHRTFAICADRTRSVQCRYFAQGAR